MGLDPRVKERLLKITGGDPEREKQVSDLEAQYDRAIQDGDYDAARCIDEVIRRVLDAFAGIRKVVDAFKAKLEGDLDDEEAHAIIEKMRQAFEALKAGEKPDLDIDPFDVEA